MRKQDRLIWVVLLLASLLPLFVACSGAGATGKQVTIKCSGCDVVELWETSHATKVVGEVKPGDTGVTKDKAWSALQGCMFYYVVVGDQEGWVCDKYLQFK
ncbi:MAG: hypothetical protein ACUVV0_04540 [Anaerolineae bacterium]